MCGRQAAAPASVPPPTGVFFLVPPGYVVTFLKAQKFEIRVQEKEPREEKYQSLYFCTASAKTADWYSVGYEMTTEMLPDNVLLEIFDFCKYGLSFHGYSGWVWRRKMLTQVCRRWRLISLGSPRRLDLRIVCTNTTPTRTSLDIWPPLPITIKKSPSHLLVDEKGVENINAALEHRDRISEIFIHGIWPLEKWAAVMDKPLPALRDAYFFSSFGDTLPPFPETFLGGSAPCLRSLHLIAIPFPSLPKFVISSTHIVDLQLLWTPNSGYISPDVMAKCLEALSNLEHLSVGFRSPLSRPVQSTLPPLIRIVLPALTSFFFAGASEYFEDFVAQIDTPILNRLLVAFFLDLIFDIPQFHDFIDRTNRLKSFNQADIEFYHRKIKIVLGSPTRFELEIKCERPDWQLSSMTQIFRPQLPILSHVERLGIRAGSFRFRPRWKADPDMDTSQWLELFHLFIAVRSLYVGSLLMSPVATALQELTGGRTLEVFPVLRNLSLQHLEPSGPAQEAIKSFITTRQLSGHPIAIQPWDSYLAENGPYFL